MRMERYICKRFQNGVTTFNFIKSELKEFIYRIQKSIKTDLKSLAKNFKYVKHSINTTIRTNKNSTSKRDIIIDL